MLSLYICVFRDRSQKCKAVLYRYETLAQTITLPPLQQSTSCMQQATYCSPVRLHTRVRHQLETSSSAIRLKIELPAIADESKANALLSIPIVDVDDAA